MKHSLKRALAVLFALLTMTSGAFASNLSIQQQFAQLQQELSKLAQQQANDRIQQVQQLQQKQKDASNALSQLYSLQNQQRLGQDATLPDDLRAFLDENGLSYGSADSPDYAVAISSTNNYLESLSTDTQTEMVYIQDYLSQYNEYLQSSAETIQQASDALQSTASGQASLFSTDGTGSGAPVAVSALGGVIVGMMLMWLIGKRSKKEKTE